MMPILTIGITIINSQINNFIKNIFPNILADNVEIICVLDSITDSNYKLLNKYINKNKNVKLIRTKNMNVSLNRNLIIKKSKGELLTFIDGDDAVVSKYSEKIIKKWESNKFDILLFDHLEKTNNILNYKKNDVKKYTNDFITNIQSMELWSKVFLTRIIKKNNINFIKSNYSISEDMYFIISYSRFVEKIIVINKPLYIYLHNDDSSTKKSTNIYKLESTLFYLLELSKIIDKNSFSILYNSKIFDFIYKVKKSDFNENIINLLKIINNSEIRYFFLNKGYKFFIKCLYIRFKSRKL